MSTLNLSNPLSITLNAVRSKFRIASLPALSIILEPLNATTLLSIGTMLRF